MIYFDHNATTPIDERVVEAMLPFLKTFYGNPSSLYRAGRIVRSTIDTAREQVAALVDVAPGQVIFTSGGTEANNLALRAVCAESKIAVSAVEHVIEAALKNTHNECVSISVDENGLVIPDALEKVVLASNSPALVSIMLANNENGVIQDIASVASLLKDKQIKLHTDAVQAVGKIPVSFSQLGVDLMSLSSHKIYGPKGCGALVMAKEIDIDPMLVGGGQECGWRAGTENVAGIVGFGKAAELALLELEQRTEHLLALRKKLERELKEIPGLVIFSEQVERLPNTVFIGLQGVDGEMLLMQLDQKNIAVSSGSACASAGGKPSPVLMAMGVDQQLAKSAIRISLGKDNTE
ncbi:MAG: cysteine desulfurase, partial [Methylococcales bacterium]|nr:cysteine desulfurase [Methylococcales bacterium]